MNNLSDIKRRIASVKQTRQITGAMETISIAKMRKAMERYENSRAYSEAVERFMRQAAQCSADQFDSNVITNVKAQNKAVLIIVITSDKGMCGAFNHDIIKLAETVANDKERIIMPLGLVAQEYYKSYENTDMRFASINSSDYSGAQDVARAVMDGYFRDYGSVTVVYSKMTSHSFWSAQAKQILPLSFDDKSKAEVDRVRAVYEFEPTPEEVFKRLVPLYVGSAIYDALVNNTVAEHSARRAAMSASTKSADEIISDLSIEYNRARQGSVTEQITEMIGSVAALGNGGGLK